MLVWRVCTFRCVLRDTQRHAPCRMPQLALLGCMHLGAGVWLSSFSGLFYFLVPENPLQSFQNFFINNEFQNAIDSFDFGTIVYFVYRDYHGVL